jgi:hypothetical protein
MGEGNSHERYWKTVLIRIQEMSTGYRRKSRHGVKSKLAAYALRQSHSYRTKQHRGRRA